MNTCIKNVVPILILFLFCILSIPRMTFAKSSTALCCWWEMSTEEVDADCDIVDKITNWASIAGYSAYAWKGTDATADNIYQAAEGVDDT